MQQVIDAGINYQGIAILLGAVAAFIIAVGGFVMQVMTFNQATKARSEGQARDARLEVIAHGVDGINEVIATGAFARGKAEGIETERAMPMVPAVPAADQNPAA